MHNFFAHAGHLHEPELPVDCLFPLVFLTLLLGVLVVWLAKTKRIKLATALLIAASYMLLVGVFAYQFMPIASIISLSAGLALTLFVTLSQFTRDAN